MKPNIPDTHDQIKYQRNQSDYSVESNSTIEVFRSVIPEDKKKQKEHLKLHINMLLSALHHCIPESEMEKEFIDTLFKTKQKQTLNDLLKYINDYEQKRSEEPKYFDSLLDSLKKATNMIKALTNKDKSIKKLLLAVARALNQWSKSGQSTAAMSISEKNKNQPLSPIPNSETQMQYAVNQNVTKNENNAEEPFYTEIEDVKENKDSGEEFACAVADDVIANDNDNEEYIYAEIDDTEMLQMRQPGAGQSTAAMSISEKNKNRPLPPIPNSETQMQYAVNQNVTKNENNAEEPFYTEIEDVRENKDSGEKFACAIADDVIANDNDNEEYVYAEIDDTEVLQMRQPGADKNDIIYTSISEVRTQALKKAQQEHLEERNMRKTTDEKKDKKSQRVPSFLSGLKRRISLKIKKKK